MVEKLATKEEYERYMAEKRGESVEEFRDWLREMDMFIIRCEGGPGCGYGERCRGWRLSYPEEYE